VVAAVAVVGVPEITPVDVLNASPVESVGDIDQFVAAPPVLVGVNDVIAVLVGKLLTVAG